jgi:hypothetical protein
MHCFIVRFVAAGADVLFVALCLERYRTNTVTSCRKCNGKKGSTPPHELKFIGMKLVREPRIPSKWELAANAEKMVPKRVHPTWRPFLGMNLLPGDEQDLEENMDAFFEEDFEY